jgi:hypothetical protein
MMNCEYAKIEIETDYLAKTNGKYSSELQKHLFSCRSCRNHGVKLTRILQAVQMEPIREIGVDLAHYTALAISELPSPKMQRTGRQPFVYFTALTVLFLIAIGSMIHAGSDAAPGVTGSEISLSLLGSLNPNLKLEDEIKNTRKESASCLLDTAGPDFYADFADLNLIPISLATASRKSPPVEPDPESTDVTKIASLQEGDVLPQGAGPRLLYDVDDVTRLLSASLSRDGVIVPLGDELGAGGRATSGGNARTTGSHSSGASARAMPSENSAASANDVWIHAVRAPNALPSVSEDPTLTPLGAYCLAALTQ